MKLNEQLKSYFTKCGHINASFYEGKACINVSLRFRTFYLSLDTINCAENVKIIDHERQSLFRCLLSMFHSDERSFFAIPWA